MNKKELEIWNEKQREAEERNGRGFEQKGARIRKKDEQNGWKRVKKTGNLHRRGECRKKKEKRKKNKEKKQEIRKI